MDYFNQQRFNALERERLEPPDVPDFDEVMENFDDYADNDAWLDEMDLRLDEQREEVILTHG